MKKISLIFAALALSASTTVFADVHLDTALEHATAALAAGKAGNAPSLMEHAKAALDHSLTASITAKSVAKNHIDAAAKSLQTGIDQGALNQLDIATKAAEESVAHLTAAK
ncbi:MAG: hypothetical protein D4R63_01645 [Methylococcaceae bacterium]|nr:MAG: hypothetical protein D4R63_01645 [Methylococcaceae bacterium]